MGPRPYSFKSRSPPSLRVYIEGGGSVKPETGILVFSDNTERKREILNLGWSEMANSPGSSFSEFDSTRSGKVPIGQSTPLTALSEYSVEELIKALEVDNLRETALRLLSKVLRNGFSKLLKFVALSDSTLSNLNPSCA
ncbi:hypothetical protein Nepgr_009009 [Nepenthes gracilis]|uniref:Uncharacterized protein n=1 Tax=Nepenthes gracilis TaxID=150966 RepID=A0AAD3XJU8_NEPGR|nr:hypothetical protein Nepgr_009009 [Nepenthes gracilis]